MQKNSLQPVDVRNGQLTIYNGCDLRLAVMGESYETFDGSSVSARVVELPYTFSAAITERIVRGIGSLAGRQETLNACEITATHVQDLMQLAEQHLAALRDDPA